MRILFKNVTIPYQKETFVVIEKGRIKGLYTTPPDDSFDQVIDGNNKVLMPGFNDSHGHFLGLSYMAKQKDISHIKSLKDLASYIETIDADVIRLSHFYEAPFETKALLTKNILDSLSPSKPLIILRACGHVLMANQKAIDEAILYHKYTPQHEHYDFEKGLFYEKATGFIQAPYLDPSLEELVEDIKTSEAHALKYGVTSFQSDDFITYPIDFERIIQAFEVASKDLKLRLYEQAHLKTLEELDRFIQKGYVKKRWGRIQMGPSKLLIDGSLGAKTAAMKHPYLGTQNTGILNYDLNTLKTYIEKLNDVDMDFSWHAIGDLAAAHILDALESVPLRKHHRHAIIHAQLTGRDEILRMKNHQVGAMIQPVFLDDDIPILDPYLGDKKDDSYLFKTLMQSVPTALSTDAPIVSIDPFKNMYHAITRKSLKYPESPPHLANEGLSFKEAYDGYTINSAYFMYHDTLGQIKPGYVADIILVDGMVVDDPQSLLNATVTLTMIEGEIVYQS